MKVNRAAWADAYNFHVKALGVIPTMNQDDFWVWYHTEAQKVIEKHNNSPLIQNLMLAVFEDTEAADIAKQQNPAPVMSA